MPFREGNEQTSPEQALSELSNEELIQVYRDLQKHAKSNIGLRDMSHKNISNIPEEKRAWGLLEKEGQDKLVKDFILNGK